MTYSILWLSSDISSSIHLCQLLLYSVTSVVTKLHVLDTLDICVCTFEFNCFMYNCRHSESSQVFHFLQHFVYESLFFHRLWQKFFTIIIMSLPIRVLVKHVGTEKLILKTLGYLLWSYYNDTSFYKKEQKA